MGKFVLNNRAIDAIAKSAGVSGYIHDLADHVLADIIRNAPYRSGAYQNSWKIEKLAAGGYRIVSDDWKAWFIEKGVRAHGEHPPFPAMHVAQRALDMLRG